MAATPVWSRPYPFHSLRVARATVTMAVLRICALLLLFDCQEAFHCCLGVACINRINMISIECHRSGERCPGKREFDNRIEINRVRSGEIMWLFPLMLYRMHYIIRSPILTVLLCKVLSLAGQKNRTRLSGTPLTPTSPPPRRFALVQDY